MSRDGRTFVIVDDILDDEPMDDEKRKRMKIWYEKTIAKKRERKRVADIRRRRRNEKE